MLRSLLMVALATSGMGIGTYSYFVGIDWNNVSTRSVGVWQTEVPLGADSGLKADVELSLRQDHAYVIRGVGFLGGTLELLARGLVLPCRKGFYTPETRLLHDTGLTFRCSNQGQRQEVTAKIVELDDLRMVLEFPDHETMVLARTAPE